MEANRNQTPWQAMGYSWRDGNGTHECKTSLRWVDPFARAVTEFHTLKNIGLIVGHLREGWSHLSARDIEELWPEETP